MLHEPVQVGSVPGSDLVIQHLPDRNVDRLDTEVIPEPEPAPQGGAPPTKTWEVVEKTREAYSRWLRDRRRIAADGFDD